MKNELLDTLLKSNEPACVSIIIPTDRVNTKKNIELLKKSIKEAKALLMARKLPDDVTNETITRIDMSIIRMPETVSEGLGFYISQHQFAVVTFPFEVRHKVIVGGSFALRDLLYLKQYSVPYFVVNLSKKGVQLFKGVLDDLEEIKDEKFPMLYEDQFEYQPAALANSSSNSLKSYEKEKNQITEIRLRSVFRDADAHVRKLLSEGTKVFLAGTQKMISLYTSVTELGDRITGKVAGSYDGNNLSKLRENSWLAYCRVSKSQIAKRIIDLQEKRGGHLAEGVQEAWTSAANGKGLRLMVEKDLHHLAYRKEGQDTIQLQPPQKPYTIIPDIVDELIDTVQSHGGEVLFTENGQLKEFHHLALVLRY